MAEVSLRDRRQNLLARTDLIGEAFCRAYAREADEWLSGIAERATQHNPRHLALLAVGGYGRSSLAPFSDLDVVLVHAGRGDIKTTADAIWYPIWDQGVRLDHSVRRPKEVLEAAREDLRVALGLLDARLVWGDPKVSQPLLDDVIRLWRSTLGALWLPALAEQMAERHRSQGDVAYLLEPELKESHGGLRDVNVLRAIAEYAPLLADYVDLESLQPAAAVLTDVRVELHRSQGRELDRLLLQEQDPVAARLGYTDADELMAAVSSAGRKIAWVSDDAWRRRRFWQPAAQGGTGLFRRRAPSTPEPAEPIEREVEPGIAIVGGEVGLTVSARVADDPSIPFRLAAVAAELDLPIARNALHQLGDRVPPPPDPWPLSTRHAFVRLLAAGHRAINPLEALDNEGLLTRLIPEWRTVRNKPQRNAYHRFTVDRHLMEAAANAAELGDRVDRLDLLVIGALFHDIGKGTPGDHTENGIAQIATIAQRMGFDRHDIETLKSMVRHHLLLPDTATRRDLDDPATIDLVADAAGDADTVALLAALTEADSLATGPAAWGAWKAGLVAELAQRATARLEGTEMPARRGWVSDLHRQMMTEVRDSGKPVVIVDQPRVMVAAPDRRGLLSSVAGTLALHGLDVRSADVTGEEGVALEVFTVEVARGGWPEGARLREDLDAVLSGQLSLGDELAEKAKAYAGGKRPDSARPVVPEVTVDNTASASSTIIEVRTLDELGLLHRVTRALFDCSLDVVSARVSTIGSEVVDAFYVRDETGEKVTGSDALSVVNQKVRAAVG